MDFKLFVDALLTGTPVAILVAAIGVIWQLVYTRSRDKLHDAQIKRERDLEDRKFEHQKALEELKFQYEQRRWREQLAHDVTLSLVEARVEEYAKVWQHVKRIAMNRRDKGDLTSKITSEVAAEIQEWRYDRGGLLAESTTRDAAYAFQKALWEYDGKSQQPTKRMRSARRLFLRALRSDIALSEDVQGKTIYEIIEERQGIREELKELQAQLDITTE